MVTLTQELPVCCESGAGSMKVIFSNLHRGGCFVVAKQVVKGSSVLRDKGAGRKVGVKFLEAGSRVKGNDFSF